MAGIVGWLFGSASGFPLSEPHQEPPLHRFTMRREDSGDWRLDGTKDTVPHRFPSLDTAIDYARRDSDAEPATIEIWVEGMYICVQQEQGWPERICAP